MTSLLRSRYTAAAALALTGALTLTACNGTDTSARPAAAASSSASAPAQITTVSGATVSVPGDKPTALFFFSVGCGECNGGAKSLAGAAETLGSAASFVLVDMNPGESAHTVTGFQSDTGTQAIPAVIDTGATLTTRYSVAALSTLLVIDTSGKVSYRASDPSTDQITTALRKAGAA
ncbi:TlpA family protein disulfide reductase [Tsukamurella columbiensis]|uniref:Redoxin domain-containing protein n=1 Tax=Tsukamurella columbiensis TaxID=128509 RepID=A0ABX1LIA9_9ACTN|nr:redoxin domain-containing protein [Tsukamurella columbiensis]NMD58019.1 redoxin domain-containing protein [Tsukamurella columbiensis]